MSGMQLRRGGRSCSFRWCVPSQILAVVDPTGLRALPPVPQVTCTAATRLDTGVDLPLGLPLTVLPLLLLYAPTGSARPVDCPALLARLVSWAAPPFPGEGRPEGASDGPASDDSVPVMTASLLLYLCRAVLGKGRPRIPEALSTEAARAR